MGLEVVDPPCRTPLQHHAAITLAAAGLLKRFQQPPDATCLLNLLVLDQQEAQQHMPITTAYYIWLVAVALAPRHCAL
jgi:hypothetical protein